MKFHLKARANKLHGKISYWNAYTLSLVPFLANKLNFSLLSGNNLTNIKYFPSIYENIYQISIIIIIFGYALIDVTNVEKFIQNVCWLGLECIRIYGTNGNKTSKAFLPKMAAGTNPISRLHGDEIEQIQVHWKRIVFRSENEKSALKSRYCLCFIFRDLWCTSHSAKSVPIQFFLSFLLNTLASYARNEHKLFWSVVKKHFAIENEILPSECTEFYWTMAENGGK